MELKRKNKFKICPTIMIINLLFYLNILTCPEFLFSIKRNQIQIKQQLKNQRLKRVKNLMGNQETITLQERSKEKNIDFEHSCITRLSQVENATLIRCLPEISSHSKQKPTEEQAPLFYLQKMFVSDSQQQYKLLAKYLEKQSLLGTLSQSSQIIKILKIYQKAQKGLCSNHYVIRVLFEYSDITIRDQLKVRTIKMKTNKNSFNYQKQHFRYDDLCSIMFACISSLFAVQKMKQNYMKFLSQNYQIKSQGFRHADFLLSQFRYNIPFSLDRIIIMPDGTIKVMHPLLLDHDNRVNHSGNCFYSPEKMKDFMIEDGIKGRMFETALVVLQCALIQNTEQMSKVYNGYCINEQILQKKISKAIQLYSHLQNLTPDDMKLFSLIRKMIIIQPQHRIDLNQCIKQAENLFQLNKILKSSINLNPSPQAQKASHQRMSIEELQFIPAHTISMKASPIQQSTAHNTVYAKQRNQQGSTAQSPGQTVLRVQRQNPQIEVSHFTMENIKPIDKTRENTSRNPLQSLFINNDHQELMKQNNEKFLKSLIGQDSNLYNTQRFDFLQSKFQYGKFYCNPLKNSINEDKSQQNNSYCKKYSSSLAGRDFMHKKLLNQSVRKPTDLQQKKYAQDFTSQSLLRKLNENSSKQAISTSKFMDIDRIYSKYNFVSKVNDKQAASMNHQAKRSFIELIGDENFHNQKQQSKKSQDSKCIFKFSQYNSNQDPKEKSAKSILCSSSNQSQVIEKITGEHIYQKLKRNRLLRSRLL